jgi:PP-loop superfamily ATP-utilizing enzyme
MENRIVADAQNLKKLIREAEALADESIIAMARLKQAMLAARQNPMVEVNTGQRALLRLTEAEGYALSMSTNLLRVHDELTKVAHVHAGGDLGDPTKIPPSDLDAMPTRQPHQQALQHA